VTGPPPASADACSHPAAAWLRFLRLAHIHAAILRLPGIDRVLRHSLLPRHIFCLSSCLDLLQRSYDLRLRVPALRHLPPLSESMKSYSAVCGFRGAGQYWCIYVGGEHRTQLCRQVRNYLVLLTLRGLHSCGHHGGNMELIYIAQKLLYLALHGRRPRLYLDMMWYSRTISFSRRNEE